MITLREISEFLVAATFLQALAFASLLLADRFRASIANRFLLAALLLMAAVKADQFYQMSGGLSAYPEWGFVLAPLQPLLTPALFFFVRARVNREFRLRAAHAAHLAPAVVYFIYLYAIYFGLSAEEKRTLVESGGLATTLNAFIVPALSDLLQLGYVAASLVVLSRHGFSLGRWFSRIDDKNLSWLKQLLAAWAAVFLLHFAWMFGVFQGSSFALAVMLVLNAAHFVFINLLLMLAIVDHAALPAAAPLKYAASAQGQGEREALFRRAAAALQERRLFLDADLTLQDLADALGTPARDLSEAINGAGAETFYSFVNRARVDFAKERLLAEPGVRILDVALASGFNSKSTFNETFRKYAGTTPSAWRASAAPARAPAASPIVK